MILSRTDSNGVQAEYLDLDIDFGFLGFYNIKLFDKRDGFNFKVINYPCLTYSNVPTSQSYGIYLSQLLRISRICTCINDFYSAVIKVTNEFLNKGFHKDVLCNYYNKFINLYEIEWCKFGVLPELPICLS